MAWRDNPLGIVIDGTQRVDLAKLKAEGLEFVVIDAAVGPYNKNPELSRQIQAAYDAKLPVLMMFTPYPDMEQHTPDGNVAAHMPLAKGITVNHLHHAYVVSVERNWTGTDYEEYKAGRRKYADIRWSTATNISDVAKKIIMSMITFYQQQSKTTPVLVRTNDGFVQGSSPQLSAWVGNYPFYLADWRYRIKKTNPDGSTVNEYVVYTAVKTPVETLAALRDHLPPPEGRNPLVPGNETQLMFWEFSGSRFVHPSVKDIGGNPTTAKWVLFNGDVTGLHAFLNYVPPSTPTDPKPGDPVDPKPGDPQEPTDPVSSKFIQRLEAAITAAAQAWLAFK